MEGCFINIYGDITQYVDICNGDFITIDINENKFTICAVLNVKNFCFEFYKLWEGIINEVSN